MAQPEWITPAGSLGSIPEGIFFQLAMLATTPAIAPVVANITCTSTNSTTNRITCNSTAGIYPGFKILFGIDNGKVIGGVSSTIEYFVLDVYSSTEFSITTTSSSVTPVSLTTESGLMNSQVTQFFVCTATDSSTNRITCNSTTGLYPGLNVMFGNTNNTVFGGISPLVRYFVLDVVNSTQFTITATEFTTTPITLTSATGTMDAEFRQHVLFNLQAGQLPSGIQVADNGLIIGTPKAVASIQGVPTQVNEDVTSKFTVRAYTQRYENGTYVLDAIRDRTFTLTVTGPNPPVFLTPPGQIATYYDGTLVKGLQIEYFDPDPNDTAIVKLVSGVLPEGLSLTPKGLISGAIMPLSPINANAGFSRDGQGYDLYSFDFSTQSVNSNYQFTLELTDGKYSQLRTFSIYVYSKNSMTADNTEVTADSTFVTADVVPARTPVITNPEGSIGTVRNDNWFAYQFNGIDFDGDQINFELIFPAGDSVGIPGLTLDLNTGWLYGFIPPLGLTQNIYDFVVRISKDIDPTIYNDYSYSLTIVGAIDSDITWLTPSNLGTINNGSTSTFYVEAVNASGVPLQYKLQSGSNSNLPQGLQLLPSGHIAGRVSFDTFALDLGTTTFDVTMNDLGITTKNTETTFDMTHRFIVQVYSTNGLIDITKEFSITVKRAYNEPYKNLYIEAMPPENDRALLQNLLQNADIFQPDLIYRPDDPNFGKAQKVVYYHAFGLKPATYADYVSSLYKNHYWKNLTLGQIKVAQARNAAGEVIYEVVYSQIIDNLLNDQGQSVSKSVTLPYPFDGVKTVYPNSLINMRDQVIDTVGEVADILPLWMTSKQANGKVLGFTPSWVLTYAKPGKGDQIAYYIQTQFGTNLNKIDFEVDRYELDQLLSKNWDPIADSTGGAWVPTPAETYFDLLPGTASSLVSWINNSDNPVGWTNNAADQVNWTNNYNGKQTTFDGNSLRFIAPVDMYSQTQAYDKYLVFPHRTILG